MRRTDHITPRGPVFEFAEGPKDSPLRMKCRTCRSVPGDKCTTGSGFKLLYFHDTRWRDFNKLRNIEAKLEDWKKRYGGAA